MSLHTWRTCTRCALHAHRTFVLRGEGNTPSDILVVAGFPSVEEDRYDRALVESGSEFFLETLRQLKMDKDALRFVYAVGCATPEGRVPFTQEVQACHPRLELEIETTDPLVIVALGGVAVQSLLGIKTPITKLQMRDFLLDRGEGYSIPVLVTFDFYHLRKNPSIARNAPRFFLFKTMDAARRIVEESRHARVRKP